MAEKDLIMPKMGESIMEATILNWLKKEGDPVEEDEPVLEIATDKVDSEVPSPYTGTLKKILYDVNDVVEVGKPIARIEVAGEEGAEAVETAPAPPVEELRQNEVQSEARPVMAGVDEPGLQTGKGSNGRHQKERFYSPLVMNIARQEGISMQELEKVPGSGRAGRVTKKDILSYLKARQAPQAAPAASPVTQAPAAPAPEKTAAPAASSSGEVEIIEMDRMRRMIADHMLQSKHTSAHVTSFVEADVTNLVHWRNKVKNDFLKREGEKLTFTPIFIELLAKVLKEFPYVNASIDGYKIIVKKYINIGMAAALPSGNLIVPVIKQADRFNLLGLAKQVNDLARRARENKLKPDEIQDGTFTLTNVGTFGNLAGTPIINQPQVAILATGAIKKKPGVVETREGDMIAVRHYMMISMSYDHRLVDGAMGGSFIRRFADLLESWDPDRAL